jgi:hypothetical protein
MRQYPENTSKGGFVPKHSRNYKRTLKGENVSSPRERVRAGGNPLSFAMSAKELIHACIAPLMAVLDASGPPGMDRTSVAPDFVRLIRGETRPSPRAPLSQVSKCRRHTELFVQADRFAAGKH